MLYPLFIFLIFALQKIQKQAVVWKSIHSFLSLYLASIISDQKSPEELCTCPSCRFNSLLELFGCVDGKIQQTVVLLEGLLTFLRVTLQEFLH